MCTRSQRTFPIDGFFGHHWYIGTDDKVNAAELTKHIDEALKALNDDYQIERRSALKEIAVDVLPEIVFLEFMEKKGKLGGQHKFPRVIKGGLYEEWKGFLKSNVNI